jgi:hypothetical protein
MMLATTTLFCTYVVINVKLVMEMVSYSAITDKDENISAHNNRQYGTKYNAHVEEVMKG